MYDKMDVRAGDVPAGVEGEDMATTTKKGKKQDEASPEVEAAVGALLANVEGENKAVALQQIQALMSNGGLQALLDAAGLKVVAKADKVRKDSRLARVREWALGTKTRLEGEELTTVQSLAEAIGKAEFPANPGDLTQQQVDDMMAEALTIRPSQDILKGRYEAIKAAVFAAMTEKEGDDLAPAVLTSPAHSHKFVRQIRESKASANFDALEGIVSDEVWKAITVTARKVDEDKLAKAVAEGKVSVDQIAEVTTPASKSASFYVRPLKDGEEVL